MAHEHKHDEKHDDHHGGHSIVSYKTAFAVFAALIVLTVITVAVSRINLGALNTPVALFVASVKSCLVIFFFMNLKSEHPLHKVAFAMGFVFLGVFLTLTSFDIFFRGNVYAAKMKEPFVISSAAGVIEYQKFWEPRAEMKAKGKELFAACVGCHGNEGRGDGPAAAAMNPKPRNFTLDANWKHGRKLSQIFMTLTKAEGLQGMPVFATLPPDHRMALAHYVRSLGSIPPEDTAADFSAAGIDTSKPDGGLGTGSEKTIPVETAMDILAKPAPEVHVLAAADLSKARALGASAYESKCLSCHGADGRGGIRVKTLGGFPRVPVETSPFSIASEGLRSQESFNKLVVNGLQGDNLMPGYGNLSATELQELYSHVRGLSR